MRVTIHETRGWIRSARVLALLLAVASGSTTWAEETGKTEWVPGEPYPTALLDRYPCHDYELPCGNMAPPIVQQVEFSGELTGDSALGEKIATNLRWGNCLSCHKLPGHPEGGTIGPSLADYSTRSLPLSYTYQRIWDVRVFNPNAHMPVYGPNRILTPEDIGHVMAYLYVPHAENRIAAKQD
ncbi:MAG: sulfur oxidation c-type cytochrome SoxX [Gammaproteobacteria bacterium]|nr:sulfur oxidation c-type cytochrome SoxX [Gammaproteobacteria bacterium]